MRPITAATPAAPQLDAAQMMNDAVTTFETFARDVLALDPQQAAIRAGLTLLIVIGAGVILLVLRLLLKALTERPSDEAQPSPAPRRSKLRLWTMRIARLAIAAGALLLLLDVWGVDLTALSQGRIGQALASAGRITFIIITGLAAAEITQIAIARLFARVAQRASSMRRAAQVRTLAPVLSGVAITALVIIAAMMVLSEVGVEIGPLIAGAGIVGLAVGFGAQTLVKDFLTGIFLILEDTVSVGDIATIGGSGAGGMVEEMTLRTIKLRDFDGTLHVFPYSEAQIIHNKTKGFSYYVFNISIAYSANILRALDVMKQTGDALQRDPEFANMILAPIEVVGVDQLGDSGVMLKARIKTQPVKQWTVGREYLKRIKLAFDDAGIEIPFPHLKLVAPDAPADGQSRAAE